MVTSAKNTVLTPTIAELPVKELAPGQGHFPAAGASGSDTRYIVGPGRGREIRAVFCNVNVKPPLQFLRE